MIRPERLRILEHPGWVIAACVLLDYTASSVPGGEP
jgi:hypothetical protein